MDILRQNYLFYNPGVISFSFILQISFISCKFENYEKYITNYTRLVLLPIRLLKTGYFSV